MLDHEAARQHVIVRLPRKIVGEWRCLDCGHLAYGKSDAPRCPNCLSARLTPTIERPEAPVEKRVADG
jgi:rubrerythrin